MNVNYYSGVKVAGFENLPPFGVASSQMTSRSETGTHITGTTINEAFTYDAQNRLTQDWVGGTDQTRKHVYKYSTNGNIDSSSIAGKYQYALPTHPHAVTAVVGIATALPTINVNASPSISCNATYNAENKVATMDNGSFRSEFTYGVDGNRYRCDFYSYINSVKTYQGSKVYIGSSEFGYNANGVQTYARTIIKAPTGVCAVYQDSNYVKEFYYVHTDYQGSWLAITNSNKAVTNRYSYDAWGRPRNVNDWTLKSVGITSALTNLNSFQPRFDRGYTGHEIMAGFGLINMNGRLYDPYLQRFLSPDPFVQAPNNSQSYNRYSYCMNNPLMYTDPSGYKFFKKLFNSFLDVVFGSVSTFEGGITMIVGGAVGVIGTTFTLGKDKGQWFIYHDGFDNLNGGVNTFTYGITGKEFSTTDTDQKTGTSTNGTNTNDNDDNLNNSYWENNQKPLNSSNLWLRDKDGTIMNAKDYFSNTPSSVYFDWGEMTNQAKISVINSANNGNSYGYFYNPAMRLGDQTNGKNIFEGKGTLNPLDLYFSYTQNNITTYGCINVGEDVNSWSDIKIE